MSFSMEEIGRVCYAYDKICKRFPYIYDYDYRGGQKTKKTLEEIRAMEYELCSDVNSDDGETIHNNSVKLKYNT